MSVDQFIEHWKSKFAEDPPGWIRYMDEPEVELEECQNRIHELTHSLEKEEFLLSYLQQQVREQSHRSYVCDDREEYSHTWSDDDDSDSSSTERVTSSVFDSVDTLQDTSERPQTLDLGEGGMRQRSLVDLAHALVENAIHEASKNYNQDILRKELISTASEPTSPDEGSTDIMDSRSGERAGDEGGEDTQAGVATDGGEDTLAEVAVGGGGETQAEVATGSNGETQAEVAAGGGGAEVSAGSNGETQAEVAADGGEETQAEVAADGGEETQAEVAADGGGETQAEVTAGGGGVTQAEVTAAEDVASESTLPSWISDSSQEATAMASSPISSEQFQRGSETSPDIKDAFKKLDEMLDCVSPLCSPDPHTLAMPHPHIVPARATGHSPPAPGVLYAAPGGPAGATRGSQVAGRSLSLSGGTSPAAGIVSGAIGTSPVVMRSSSSKHSEGQNPALMAQTRSSHPQGPRIFPVSPTLGEGHTDRPAGAVLGTRRTSQDKLLEPGAAGRQSGRRSANPIHRVPSGPELDEISLSFDDLPDYETDSQANLEQAVLSDLSESASAFYSVLASQSLHSLDDLDGGQRVLMGSTDDMLNEGDMEMKQYWMQNRPKRRSPSHSSSTGLSGEGIEERKRPSRVSALYRTTVVEGETLVMRKLVVSGIVSAEKTYLTWLTILKENYRAPLLAVADTSHPLLDEKSIRTIFYGIDELQELHSRLYAQFEERAENWSSDVCVGEIFIELCKCITLYRDYVEMYHKSIGHLKRSRQSVSSFQQFLGDVHESVARTIPDVPSVEDLLRKPIERLQSYSLVLNDLCQHTPEDHADYRILRESLKAMSDFIASTNDPMSFRELSYSQNKQLVKDQLMVELSEGVRKVRSLLLFNDLLVCAKQKRARDSVKLEHKWHIPLADLMFVPPPDAGTEARKPVTATSDVQLSAMRSRIAELKAQLKGGGDRDSAAMGSLGRRKGKIATKSAKLVKKLNEQLAEYWVAEPSLPLRFFTTSGKNYVFVVHSEDIRESWIAAIKKLQPKAEKMSLSVLDVQDLLNKQKLNSTRDISSLQTGDEREYLTGVIRVQVKEARDLKVKPNLYCALEVDEYGRFYRKARTTPAAPIEGDVQWDQGFEIDLDGSQKMRVLVCAKQLLKEEVIARGSCVLPVVELRRGRRVKSTISLHPQGTSELVLQYFTSHDAMAHKPALASSGVFGVPLNDVTVNEKHDIPLLVETCVHEVERRGLTEVGIYRVAGVMRDLDELSKAFDTDYLKAQSMAADMDIHAVAGLLKKYFRQLPEPLFTDPMYTSFIQGFSLKDPDARDQCLITLLHSLPLSHFRTAIYILEHLKRVADYSNENKMTLTNLATLFGPNLIRPGKRENRELEATLDIMSQVGVLMYYLSLPSEMYDITEWQRTSPSTLREKLHGASDGSSGSSEREVKTLKDDSKQT